jgi:hypothetical protein
MFIDDVNDIRRVRKAREDYVREEGREAGREEGERIGYDKAGAEYQGRLSAKDEELSARDEQIRRLEAEVRRLRGE